MKNILITGGSGFIGTHLVTSLSKENKIINIDIKKPKIREHTQFWVSVDICDKEALKDVFLQFHPEIVIHLAARTDLKGNTVKDYPANTIGVRNLLEVIQKTDTVRQVIFTSSMYVCYPGYNPKNDNDYAPHTAYGESKVITEKLIKEHNPNYTWSIIRPTSIWGPYFGEPYDKFFHIVLSHAYFHLGEKACKKTYGYVGNAIYQINSILHAEKEFIDKKTFYIGDYEPYDITEWANEIAAHEHIRIPTIPFFLFRIAAAFGDFLKLIGITFPMTSFRLKNMTTNNIQDLTQIRKLAPNLPFSREKGNEETIKWIKNNHSK